MISCTTLGNLSVKQGAEALPLPFSPPLWAFAAQGRALEEPPHFGQPTRADREDGDADAWRTVSSLCHGLLGWLELNPLRTILTEARKLAQWGYYLTFYSDIEAASINQAGRSLLDLLPAGNIRGFADGPADCCCQTLNLARQFTVEQFHLAQARTIATPQLRL